MCQSVRSNVSGRTSFLFHLDSSIVFTLKEECFIVKQTMSTSTIPTNYIIDDGFTCTVCLDCVLLREVTSRGCK